MPKDNPIGSTKESGMLYQEPPGSIKAPMGMLFTRETGVQNDHATAFSVLEQQIQQIVHLSGGIHTTPVQTELTNIFTQEKHVLQACGLINPQLLLAETTQLIGTINDSSLNKQISQTNIPVAEEAILEIISAYEKFCKKNEKHIPIEELLKIYGKIIVYNNLAALLDALNSEFLATQQDAKIRTGAVVANAKESTQKLKKTNTLINKLPKPALTEITREVADKEAQYEKSMHGRRVAAKLTYIIAKSANELPFVAFIPVKGVSGKGRHGGGATAAALSHLKNSPLQTNDDIHSAVISIALLLDFHPLTQEKLKEQNDKKEKIILGKINPPTIARFTTRATHLVLTRDNDANVFSYVVAKHWRMVCAAFPLLKESPKSALIKDGFVEHMINRWSFADKTPSVNKAETAFKQEEEEYIEKTNANSNPGRWEKTNINIDECKKAINYISIEYERSYASLATFVRPPSHFQSDGPRKQILSESDDSSSLSTDDGLSQPSLNILELTEKAEEIDAKVVKIERYAARLIADAKKKKAESAKIRELIASIEKEATAAQSSPTAKSHADKRVRDTTQQNQGLFGGLFQQLNHKKASDSSEDSSGESLDPSSASSSSNTFSSLLSPELPKKSKVKTSSGSPTFSIPHQSIATSYSDESETRNQMSLSIKSQSPMQPIIFSSLQPYIGYDFSNPTLPQTTDKKITSIFTTPTVSDNDADLGSDADNENSDSGYSSNSSTPKKR